MQFTDLTPDDEPEHDTAPEQIRAPRIRAVPPQFGQCCYPIGEPRTPGFRYCTAPVAPGAVYCLEHWRLCHMEIAA
jgi:GcrA cell cycle regulator